MSQIAVENKMQLGQLLLSRGVVTEEQIEHIMEQVRNRIQTRTRTSWEEIAEEWKTRHEERQQNTNESQGN